MTGWTHNQNEFSINPTAPLFAIGVVSDMVSLPVWTLRKLDKFGIVSPTRTGSQTRCYSKRQIQKLTYIQYLMNDKNVSIGNIKVFLEIESQ